ncbi:MAG: tRNA (adenosine(37)-N6)-threonylcarbamoyltransferase complex dimerization subunit type 1 TsaB [Bacteroidota bacterium]
MSLILAIETATPVCSVALSRDGKILSLRESSAPNVHSSVLTVFVEDVFRETSLHFTDLDAVSVSMGPGSYTGLRIGVASAKGLCYALDKPMIAVHTLEAMAMGMISNPSHNPSPKREGSNSQLPTANCQLLFCPMIDARRMEVFCAVYDENRMAIRPVEAVIIERDTFKDLLAEYAILFAGNGAEKCREVLSYLPNALFIKDFQASARFMIPLAEKRFHENRFENLAYFEPFYLKDFVAGKSNVKGLK